VSALVHVGLSIIVASTVLGQSATPKIRELIWSRTQPVASRLLPDDEVVVIRDIRDADLVIVPRTPLTIRQAIEGAAVDSEAVAIVHVELVDGVLSRRDTWVETRIAGTITEVLRTSSGYTARRGQHVEVRWSAGEITIGHIIVRSVFGRREEPVDYASKLPVDRLYLMFLNDAGDRLFFPVETPVLIEDGKLRYPWPEGSFRNQPTHPLEGLALSDVTRMVKRAKKSWTAGGTTPKR
jgi:hypothetical protein